MAFNVLLVDDSATTRGVMSKTFRLSGIPLNEIHEAATGQEALDVLKKHWIDIVFTDLNMPIMDGVELVTRMGQDGMLKTIPVVLVTIEGSAMRIDEMKKKGIHAFIRKPFTPEMIQEVFDKVMWTQMRTADLDRVAGVFAQMLERFAFMFGEITSKEDLKQAPQKALTGFVRFQGPAAGQLSLTIPEELGPAIAGNVLGIDENEPLSAERAEDALKELINVVCGQTLTALAGEGPVFHLSVPEIKKVDATEWKAILADKQSMAFLVEEKPVLLQFKLEERG